jgi:putative glutamine amidotransferase
MQLTIGITATEARYENYPQWIKGGDVNITVIQLSSETAGELNKCDGIILSGGVDTHPSFYGSKRLDYPLAPDTFNIERDTFELAVFNYSQKNAIPVLAICRGMQLINIALGGDLVQDIQESGKLDHRRHGGKDGEHEINVIKNSMLYTITGCEKGIVNSAHHQALGKIAPALQVTAFSADGVAESAEWKETVNKSFLLCVQWHPERLAQEQPDNPFTKTIREQFLKAVQEFKITTTNNQNK